MSKEELINYVIKQGYEYSETPKTIDINKITDEVENVYESITLDKENKEIVLWMAENGSGKAHILNNCELTILIELKRWLDE